MIIGIDISPIQGPHRMRGIGSVIINFINHISKEEASTNKFVFYLYEEDKNTESVLDLIRNKHIEPEVRYITDPVYKFNVKKLSKALRIMKAYVFGDPRNYDTRGLDVFIQMDQNTPLPQTRARKVLFAYDLIPYVLESRYLISYRTTRNTGSSRKRSIKNQLRRMQYKFLIKGTTRKANQIVAISEHTRRDFMSVLKIRPSKIAVAPLGAPDSVKPPKDISIRPYRDTSWGAFQGQPIDLDPNSFMLYIGGIDKRRQLLDLFAAYNNLKARGESIKLVLAGDILTSINNIPEQKIRDYITKHSYTDDILFLGFITEEEKAWLYHNALAVVYPSVYEGFGLPVLEAMKHGTPVITYKNSSIKEVGGKAALYADDEQDITDYLLKLKNQPDWHTKIADDSIQRASTFSWDKTVKQVFEIIAD